MVVGFKADCLTRDLGLGGMPSVGVFLRDPSPYLRVSEKTTENSERLGRQARPGIKLVKKKKEFDHNVTENRLQDNKSIFDIKVEIVIISKLELSLKNKFG